MGGAGSLCIQCGFKGRGYGGISEKMHLSMTCVHDVIKMLRSHMHQGS